MDIGTFNASELMEAAKMAEMSERYEDMCRILKKLVEGKSEEEKPLEVEERNLLSVAYKNVVGAKRQSWRTLTHGGSVNGLPDEVLNKYKSIIEKELEKVCNEVLNLLKKATAVAQGVNKNGEDVIFYLKMSGDYYRYLSEFMDDSVNAESAAKFYKDATEAATVSLPETHPTRLGLALNYSVCCYEILNQQKEACRIAKEAFDSAIEKLDTLDDSSYKDSTLIMQLLRDNLTLWTSEKDDVEDADQ